jgi:hypothetical protein
MQMYDNGEHIRYELVQIKKQILVLTMMTALSMLIGIANIIMLVWAVQQ